MWRYSESIWEAFLILNSFYWYFEGKIFQLAHSIPCLEKCLLQLCSQLLHGTGGFITGLSSPEFIRNKNLIELRQLSMQEQLPVADVLSPRRQVCLFDRTEGARPATDPGLPCQVLLGACWVSPAPFPFPGCRPSIFEHSCLSFSSGKLLHQLNWYCLCAVIFMMSVAAFASLSACVTAAGGQAGRGCAARLP